MDLRCHLHGVKEDMLLRGCVPVRRVRQINKWYAKWQTPKLRGSVPTDRWVRPGRKAGATVADVQAAFEAGSVGGRAVNGDTLADAWVNLENSKRGEKGLAPLPTSRNPSKSTRRRLQVAVGLHPDAAIGRKLAKRNRTRVGGWFSLTSNFSYAIQLCAAGYFSDDKPLSQAELDNMTPTHKWVSEVAGTHLNMRPIRAGLMFGLDDVTMVATRGKAGAVQWTAVNTREDNGTFSHWTADDQDDTFVLRSRFTMVSSADGAKSRIIMTVAGLSEEELGGKSCVVIKVLGATPAAVSNPSVASDVSADNYGLLVLQTHSADVQNTTYVYENEVEEMVEAVRRQDPQYNPNSLRPCDTALIQVDGAIAPLVYSDSPATSARRAKKKIRFLKTAAACSMTQAAVRCMNPSACRRSSLLG